MMRRQRGVTLIGWIFLLTPMAVVLYAGIRVGPIYLNYYKVVSALEKAATQAKSDPSMTKTALQGTINKLFDIGYIDKPRIEDIAFQKSGEGWSMTADYEETAPLFGNIYLLMPFKKTVTVGKTAPDAG
jgi:hypothetical protein